MTALPPGHREAYGPQTWALIREAYLAGTPAPHLSRTFGPHVDTLRKRAVREGWTRTAHAAAQERAHPPGGGSATPALAPDPYAPPPEPAALLAAAVAQASAHLAAGREAQADAALRRGETLVRLAEHARRLRPTTLADLEAARHELWLKLEALAEDAAHRALTDPHDLAGPLGDWAYRWRATHLGPECAAADVAKRAAFGR